VLAQTLAQCEQESRNGSGSNVYCSDNWDFTPVYVYVLIAFGIGCFVMFLGTVIVAVVQARKNKATSRELSIDDSVIKASEPNSIEMLHDNDNQTNDDDDDDGNEVV
jgi:hypothetical protein